jgi:PAS domain S-box-containing protein
MTYQDKLNETLLAQSQNELFYIGDISGGAQVLVKQIIEATDSDLASVWLYNNERNCIILQQLYSNPENKFYQGNCISKKDFPQYFDALDDDQVIAADDAETHPATSCFLEAYLKPLGIKSMLDVPIWYRGRTIGVICIENISPRVWKKEEIDFARILSSFYSFAFSVSETNSLAEKFKISETKLNNRMTAINRSNAVIEFAMDGSVKYANDNFLALMGYTLEEIVGKHHRTFVPEEDRDTAEYQEFWKTLRSGEYTTGKIVRVKKDGGLIHLQATYNPVFDSNGDVYSVMKIATDITEKVNQQREIEKKNTYLEHAAKILRHDMHSGINTYIPRGISSLERRLGDEKAKELKIEAPIKMIKEGLKHAQKVYRGVYEFTNLVKKDVVLNKTGCDLKSILEDYLNSTAYRANVEIQDLGSCNVNEALFCTALDNLIRNGLKYNDSSSKLVKIYRVNDRLFIEDNGRGLSSSDFKHLSQPYVRKEGQKESGSGLGLNICIAILEEHGFSISCDKLPQGGTKIEIILSTCGS